MTVDVASLEGRRSYVDQDRGIRESFFQLEIGGGSTFAVLSESLGDPRPFGWILCHSFGLEQIYLQSIETPIARRMSGLGFPVLRFHAQGYGDSELPVHEVSLQTHVRDTVDAVSALVDITGVSRVGLMGARFGGAVAALAADQVGGSALALWHPVVSGRSYMHSLLRQSTLSDLASVSTGRTIARPEEQVKNLEMEGVVDLQGFPVTRTAFDAFKSMDLVADLSTFQGDSLLVQISSQPAVDVDLDGLATRFRELGGTCAFEIVTHRRARGFGLPRFRPAGDHKVDTQADLLEDLVTHTIEWSRSLADGGDPRVAE